MCEKQEFYTDSTNRSDNLTPEDIRDRLSGIMSLSNDPTDKLTDKSTMSDKEYVEKSKKTIWAFIKHI